MTQVGRIDADPFLVLSAMIRRILVIRVLLNRSLLRTPMADPVYTIENPSRWGFNLMCGMARRGGGPTVRGGANLRHPSWSGYRHVPLAEDLLGYRHVPLAEDLSSYEPA
jgi:hypothetical protein